MRYLLPGGHILLMRCKPSTGNHRQPVNPKQPQASTGNQLTPSSRRHPQATTSCKSPIIDPEVYAEVKARDDGRCTPSLRDGGLKCKSPTIECTRRVYLSSRCVYLSSRCVYLSSRYSMCLSVFSMCLSVFEIDR